MAIRCYHVTAIQSRFIANNGWPLCDQWLLIAINAIIGFFGVSVLFVLPVWGGSVGSPKTTWGHIEQMSHPTCAVKTWTNQSFNILQVLDSTYKIWNWPCLKLKNYRRWNSWGAEDKQTNEHHNTRNQQLQIIFQFWFPSKGNPSKNLYSQIVNCIFV